MRKIVEIVGNYEGGIVLGGYEAEALCEKIGIMPDMSSHDFDKGYDERRPGGFAPEVEIHLNNDNTGEVIVNYQEKEYSESFSETDGELVRFYANKKK